MNIGIGITTYNRPECLAKCLAQINKHTDMGNVTLVVATDTDSDRRGVAYRKNECLRAFQDCDHIFLFDDDCYPIKDGWTELFIMSTESHLLYLNKNDHQFIKGCEYAQCGGVFMYISGFQLARVGAFNEKFGLYGFEHAEYSNRIYGKRNYYLSLPNTDKYIFAEDYNTMNFKSSITENEKLRFIKNNWNKYFNNQPLKIYIPL